MGDRGQQLHALLEIGGNPRLHRVEGTGGVDHFVRTFLVQLNRVRVGIEGFHGVGQPRQGPDGDAHGQPGAGDHQRQLPEQHHWQPRRQWRHRGAHVDGYRAAVAQAQVALKMLFRAGNIGEGQGIFIAQDLSD